MVDRRAGCSVVLCVHFLLRIVTANAEDAPPPGTAISPETLAAATNLYHTFVAQSLKQYEADIIGWPAAYQEELRKLEETLSKAGNRGACVAVQEEAKRFTGSGTIDGGSIVGEPEKLAELQMKYANVGEDAMARHGQRIATLKQAHVARLKELKRKLTGRKMISDAQQVEDEIRKCEIVAGAAGAANPGSPVVPDTGTGSLPTSQKGKAVESGGSRKE